MFTMTALKVQVVYTLLKAALAVFDLTYMAKSKTKNDYIAELLSIVKTKANKCTVKQLKQLIAKNA